MKRATIVVFILLASGIVWASSQRQVDRLSQRIDSQRAVVAEHRRNVSKLQGRVEVVEPSSLRVKASLETLRQESEHVSPEALSLLEQLRTGDFRELPGNWRTVLEGTWDASSTHVLLPKQAVKPALSGTMVYRMGRWSGMTPVAVAALGLKPEQADWIEHWGTNLVTSATDWTRGRLLRSEPGDGVLFGYAISPDSTELNQLMGKYKSALADAIGADRSKLVSELLLVDLRLSDARFAASGAELTVSKERDGTLHCQFLQGTVIATPHRESFEVTSLDQPFPVVFSSLFPGGWAELLAKEGISLPAGK